MAGFSLHHPFAGKFATDSAWKIPSRVGMTLLYTPAMLVFPYAAAFGLWGHGADIGIVGALVTLHFAKRVLECLFLHRYSGTINVGSTLMITCI